MSKFRILHGILAVSVIAVPLCVSASSGAQQLPPGFLQRLDHAEQTIVMYNCTSPEAQDIMTANIPNILDLGPDAAHIVALSNGNTAYFRPIDNPTTMGVMCYEHITWSNGLRTDGMFREWLNQYGQMMVAWRTMETFTPR